jgi:deazaflavin-dependent oxidoreductase (nitroreductase family)
MDDDLLDRLGSTRTIEISTVGRRSGRKVRIEIWWFRFEDRFVITGTPGPRDWLANLEADPRITVHVLGRELEAVTRPLTDREFRARFFAQSDAEVDWYRSQAELDALVKSAPMVELAFEA